MTADKTARENNNGQEKHRGTAKETAKVTRRGGDGSYETDTPAQKEWPQAQARQGLGTAARSGGRAYCAGTGSAAWGGDTKCAAARERRPFCKKAWRKTFRLRCGGDVCCKAAKKPGLRRFVRKAGLQKQERKKTAQRLLIPAYSRAASNPVPAK